MGEHTVELGHVAKALAAASVTRSPVGCHVQETVFPGVEQAALGGVPDVGKLLGVVDRDGGGNAVNGLAIATDIFARTG